MDYLSQQFIAAARRLRGEISSLKQSIDSIRDQQERHHQEDKANEKLGEPISANIAGKINAHVHETDATQREKRTRDNRQFRVQLCIALGTWAAVIAAAAYAGISLKIAKQTRRAAEAAEHQAQIAQGALDEAHRNFLLDERAWVGVRISDFTITNAEPSILKFSAKGSIGNSGRTPALNVSAMRIVQIKRPAGEIIDPDREWDQAVAEEKRMEQLQRKIIKQQRAKNPAFFREFSSVVNTQSQMWNGQGGAFAPASDFPKVFVDQSVADRDVLSREQIPYWLGRITYQDIFSTQVHTTKFCIWWANGRFELCPQGNWMD